MSRPPFSWHMRWSLTLFALALLPVLISLGFWQLGRATEKELLQQQFDAQRAAPAVPIGQLTGAAADYTRLLATGHFDNEHSFLLDNRVLDGHVGFEVITPLAIGNEPRRLLVNRGWIAGDISRRQLPVIPDVEGTVTLAGHLYRDSEGFLLSEEQPEAATWPLMLQGLKFDAVPHLLGEPVFDFTLRLDPGQPGALQPRWSVVNMDPAHHVGYAVQWFSLAAVLVIAWLLASSNLWQWLRGTQS